MSFAEPHRRRHLPQRPPPTVHELAERALDNLYDENKPLKHYLRVAERYRKDAKDYYSKGDLENAFILFARAATLVLDKLPTHRDYYTLLSITQRSNLSWNGQNIVDNLSDLKIKLINQYDEWLRAHPETEHSDPVDHAPTTQNETETSLRHTRSKGREREREKSRHGHQRRINEVYTRWQQDEYDDEDGADVLEREWRRNREGERNRDRGVVVAPQPPSPRTREAKKEAAVAAARQAASMPQTTSSPDYTFSRAPLRVQNGQASVVRNMQTPTHAGVDDEKRRVAEAQRQYQYEQQQIAMKHRQEEIVRKRDELRRRKEEQESILQRQRESEQAAHAARVEHRTSNIGQSPAPLTGHSSIASVSSIASNMSTGSSLLHQPPAPSSAVTSSFYQTPGSSLTTVVYTNTSQNPIPMPAPPIHIGQPSMQQSIPVQSSISAVTSPIPPPVPSPVPPSTSTLSRPTFIPAAVSSVPPPMLSAPPTSSSHPPPPVIRQQGSPAPAPSSAPPSRTEVAPRPSSFLENGPTMLPLESPSKFEGDSTDSESVHASQESWRRYEKQRADVEERADLMRTPTRRIRSPSPITTTSPPPAERGFDYPRLMSQHQKKQGYYPSIMSVTEAPAPLVYPPAIGDQRQYQTLNRHLCNPTYHAQQGSQSTNTDSLGRRSSLSTSSHRTTPQIQFPPLSASIIQSGTPIPLPTPPIYLSPSAANANGHIPATQSLNRSISRSVKGYNTIPILKTVTLPRDCLQRFLAIAKVNTTMNKETCGLLLGKDKGNKYVVTTLLIPKQHSTSDTCTMDEEELVLQFTEERSLITLGWIHTHPSQSCFMSSLDLHTHSGFQRMLPESFAVVCAPKSNPNFGIFRLTDPPGLKAILECKEKEAFHPHPDLPIYTDADKGHVQMRDGLLEIVDLR